MNMVEGGPKQNGGNEKGPDAGGDFDAMMARAMGETPSTPASATESSAATAPDEQSPAAARAGGPRQRRSRPEKQLPSVAHHEGESKADRLRRLLVNPPLATGKQETGGVLSQEIVNRNTDDFFNRSHEDYPFRTLEEDGTEGKSLTFKEARQELEGYLAEQGYPKSAIKHAVTYTVVPLQNREFELRTERDELKKLKPDSTNKDLVNQERLEDWRLLMRMKENKLQLTRNTIQLTLRSVFEVPELYEIEPAAMVPSGKVDPESGEAELVPEKLTVDELAVRLQGKDKNGEDAFWVDPLVKNGEHLGQQDLRKVLNQWLEQNVSFPDDESATKTIGHLKQAFIDSLVSAHVRSGVLRERDRKNPTARHERQQEVERDIEAFLRDLQSEDAASRYKQAMDNSDLSGIPESLHPYFGHIVHRPPVFYGHADRAERRQWANEYVAGLPPELIDQIATAVAADGESSDFWADTEGNRPLFSVRAIAFRILRGTLTTELERSSGEADDLLQRFNVHVLNPVFARIAESAKALRGASQAERKKLRADIEAAYRQLSDEMYDPITDPVSFWRMLRTLEPAEGDSGEIFDDIEVYDENYTLFLTFAVPESSAKEQWQVAFKQFREAHEIHLRVIAKMYTEAAQQVSSEKQAASPFIDLMTTNMWELALDEAGVLLEGCPEELTEPQQEQFIALVQKFVDREGELDTLVEEQIELASDSSV